MTWHMITRDNLWWFRISQPCHHLHVAAAGSPDNLLKNFKDLTGPCLCCRYHDVIGYSLGWFLGLIGQLLTALYILGVAIQQV